MRVSREEDILLLVRTLHHHANKSLQASLDLLYLFQKPQTHVCRDLIIARPSGVQLATQRADELAQSTFVRSVDVFVVCLDLELCRRCLDE